MHSRRDPRAEPDDPPESSEREERYVPRGSHGEGHPDSAKRRASSPPRSRAGSDARVDPSPAVEANDLVELPVEPVTSYARARTASVRPPPSESKSGLAAQVSHRPPIDAVPASRIPSSSHVVTSIDPRLEQVEPIIDEGNWQTVRRQLGSLEDSGRLPPTLGLIAAVAHTELAGEAGCPEASDLAIRCMAGVFGIRSESAIGRVLAKRLLRRNQRPAPVRASVPAAAAFILMAVFLAAGLVGGYLIGSGTLKVHF